MNNTFYNENQKEGLERRKYLMTALSTSLSGL
jgi:hypothetical protein